MSMSNGYNGYFVHANGRHERKPARQALSLPHPRGSEAQPASGMDLSRIPPQRQDTVVQLSDALKASRSGGKNHNSAGK